MPWLNKKEYNRIMDIEGESLKHEHNCEEYKKLLVKAKRRIDELEVEAPRYIRIKEPQDEETYYRELVNILANETYQYFIYNFRESVIKQASECKTPEEHMKSAGKLEAIEEMASRMKAGFQAHNTLIELEDDEDE